MELPAPAAESIVWEMPSTRTRPTLLFDGECEVCARGVHWVETHAGDAVDTTPYQGVAPPPGVSAGELEASVHLVHPDGRVQTGAEALFEVLSHAPGGRAARWCYRRLPLFAPLAEWAYRWFAVRRHRIARRLQRAGAPGDES